jgi:uncharacterized membrane protein
MDMLMEYLMEAIGVALAAVLIFVVNQYLIPWLKIKIGNDQYDELVKKIKDLMIVAEQHYGPQTGTDKKAWVISELKKLGLNFDEEMVGNLIDGFTRVLTAEGVINENK